jgi:Protein of unknown function (DUF2510)
MSDDPASWQPDPTGKHDHRYWDGTRWTENVADGGVASTDPYEPDAEEVVSPDAPTVVTPVSADDTSAYPTAVSPGYAPSPPMATDGTGGDGSRRRLAIGGAILAAVVLAVIAFFALNSDDDAPTAPLADESTQTTEDEAVDETTDADEGTSDDADEGETQDEPEDEFGDGDFFEDIYGFSEEQAECLVERITEAMEEGDLDEEQALSHLFEYLSDCDISLEDITGAQG